MRCFVLIGAVAFCCADDVRSATLVTEATIGPETGLLPVDEGDEAGTTAVVPMPGGFGIGFPLGGDPQGTQPSVGPDPLDCILFCVPGPNQDQP